MDKLTRNFLSIKKRFENKKSYFSKIADRWNRRGKKSLAGQVKLLIADADSRLKEISNILEEFDVSENKYLLKVKINSFEGVYRELYFLTRPFYKRISFAVIFLALIVFVSHNFIFGIYHVSNGSSEATLLIGDRVWVNKTAYIINSPKCGDLIFLEDPSFKYDDNFFQRFWQKFIGIEISRFNLKAGPKRTIKRIIANQEDVVEGKIENKKSVLYKNNELLQEPYVNKLPLIALKKKTGITERDFIGSFKIPENFKNHEKIVLYSYDPKLDFEDQIFYYIDHQNILYDNKTGFVKTYNQDMEIVSKDGKNIDIFGPVEIPKNKYWVMGDNRINSFDSREFGLVDKSRICGRVSFVVWSLDSEEPFWFFEIIKKPFRFWSSVRWNIFFREIK